MKILFIVFVSATYVFCHPVSDPKIPSNGVQIRDASENDISIKRSGATETAEAALPTTSETSMKSVLNNLDNKGLKIIQDIITKMANGMKTNETENAEKREYNSEKLLKFVAPDILTEIQNKNEAPEVPIFDYVTDEYKLINQNPSKGVDTNVENPEESVFQIVPFGIEKSDSMPKNSKLDRNVNKLENENMQDPLAEEATKTPKKEETFVEIPLDVQNPNQEDHYLPDLDIPEEILNDSSLNNPLLSPYDTLPLNTFPQESISMDETTEEIVNPYFREEVAAPVTQDAEFQNSEDNFIDIDLEKDVPSDYDDVTYQDYNPNDKMPMTDNYDFNGRNFPSPSYNQMPMMNPYYMNNGPFEQSMNIGSHYPSRSTSFPRNEFSTVIYSNPKTSPMISNSNDILQNMSDDQVSLLIERLFPGMLKKSYPQNSKKDVILYVDTYPEFTQKENNPFLQNEMKLREIKANYENKPQDFLMEIGNMNPMNGNRNRMTGNMNPMAGNINPMAGNMNHMAGNMNHMTGNDYNPLQMTKQDDYDKNSFGIKPAQEDLNEIPEEEDFNAESDMNDEMVNQPIFDMPDINPYYGYRTYAPQYYHAMYMSPEEYNFHYPNSQYMSKPFYNGPPGPMYDNYKMGPQGYFSNRNPTPYFPGPMIGAQMNMPYNYPSNLYDSNVRNYDWRFYNPNHAYMNYDRFAPNNYDRYPVPPY